MVAAIAYWYFFMFLPFIRGEKMADKKIVDGRNYKDEYEKLRKIHIATNAGVSLLENENKQLREQNSVLIGMLESANNQLNAQKQLNHNVVSDNNETQRKNSAEIQRLREMVKSLGGDPDKCLSPLIGETKS